MVSDLKFELEEKENGGVVLECKRKSCCGEDGGSGGEWENGRAERSKEVYGRKMLKVL